MSEIKANDYIRTDEGIIQKCTETDNNYVYADNILSYNFQGDIEIPNCYIEKSRIAKHSPNIIDLIEVGDYVNGYKVLEMVDSIYPNSKRILIYKNQKEKYERWIYIQEYDGKIHTQDDIESIVTHEQFERESYKVGG